MEKEENDNTTSFCPSFSSYTNNGLAETADRVRLELSSESNHDVDDDDSFEFVNLRSDCETASSLVFPIFNQVIDGEKEEDSSRPTKLKDLFLRDRDDPSSSSSSSSDEEEDELDGISSEIYCPWTPAKSQQRGWRKSKSTGSSSSSASAATARRWRIRDLLKRSYSEGKQSISFLNNSRKYREEEPSKKMKKKEKVSSAHEKFYLKNKAMKEEEKRRSYLPYKQDLVGLFFFNLHHRYYGKTLPSSSS